MTQTEYPVPPGKPEFTPSGKRIIYDKDGKPCRTCNALRDFKFAKAATTGGAPKNGNGMNAMAGMAAAGGVAAAAASASKDSAKVPEEYRGCPPDSEELGRASWTLLHAITASYPEKPTIEEQSRMETFVKTFSHIYPCFYCAGDFQRWIAKTESAPETDKEYSLKKAVQSQEFFGRWMCNAHNEVNSKLGKPIFDCDLWKQRWRDGWADGSCD